MMRMTDTCLADTAALALAFSFILLMKMHYLYQSHIHLKFPLHFHDLKGADGRIIFLYLSAPFIDINNRWH